MADENSRRSGDKGSLPEHEPTGAAETDEATGPDDYDGAWKEMSGRFFPHLLRLCHPKAHADIDWSKGVESLDKDLKKLLPKSKTSSRWADKLMKVWRRAAQPRDGKDFVDWLKQLPEPFEERLDKEVEKMEVTRHLPYMTPWERRGLKKGRQEGRQEGHQEGMEMGLRRGKAELLKSMASQRFGQLAGDAVEHFDRADIATLDRWSRRLFDAERLEDLFD